MKKNVIVIEAMTEVQLLRVRPCEHDDNEETRHLSLGSFFAESSFLSLSNRVSLRGDLQNSLGCLPVFIEPNLSGGYRIDDNQTAAKQIKVIKPITGNQTPFTSLLIWINSRGLLRG